MTPSPLPLACQDVLAAIQTFQQQAAWKNAAQYLAIQVEQLLAHCPEQALVDLLPHFPADVLNQNPDLHFVQGLMHAKAGRLTEAINLLERAQMGQHRATTPDIHRSR